MLSLVPNLRFSVIVLLAFALGGCKKEDEPACAICHAQVTVDHATCENHCDGQFGVNQTPGGSSSECEFECAMAAGDEESCLDRCVTQWIACTDDCEFDAERDEEDCDQSQECGG